LQHPVFCSAYAHRHSENKIISPAGSAAVTHIQINLDWIGALDSLGRCVVKLTGASGAKAQLHIPVHISLFHLLDLHAVIFMPATVPQVIIAGTHNALLDAIANAGDIHFLVTVGTPGQNTCLRSRAGSQSATLSGDHKQGLAIGIKCIQKLTGNEHLYMLHKHHNKIPPM